MRILELLEKYDYPILSLTKNAKVLRDIDFFKRYTRKLSSRLHYARAFMFQVRSSKANSNKTSFSRILGFGSYTFMVILL